MAIGISSQAGKGSSEGLSWEHILNNLSGGIFGKGHKEDAVENHQRRENEELKGIGEGTGKEATGVGEPHSQIAHPALKNIMAQLNEKDEEAPMGGGKGRYVGRKG